MNQAPTAQEIQAAKDNIYAQGKTIKQWAEDNGFPPKEVYKIMSGERKGLYGMGYKIAVAIGLKKTA